MGEVLLMNPLEWMRIASKVVYDSGEIEETVGTAIFYMALKLYRVAKPDGVTITEELDLKLASQLDNQVTELELAQYVQYEYGHAKSAVQFFTKLHGLSGVVSDQILSRLGLLMGPTYIEEEMETIPSVWDSLRDDWRLGKVAEVMKEWDTKAGVASRNQVLAEIYSLVVLRLLELNYGAVVKAAESGSSSDNEEDDEDSIRESSSVVSKTAFNKLSAQVSSMQESVRQLVATLQASQPAMAPVAAVPAGVTRANRANKTRSLPIRRATINLGDSDLDSDDSPDNEEVDEELETAAVQRGIVSSGIQRMFGATAPRAVGGRNTSGEISSITNPALILNSQHAAAVPRVIVAPLKESFGESFVGDEALAAAYGSCKATYADVNMEVPLSSFLAAITSETGLLLLDVRGIPHVFKSKSSKKCNPITTCVIYNPNGNVELSSLSIRASSPFLFPVTSNHAERNFEDQIDKVFEPSAFHFCHTPMQSLQYLRDYMKRFRALMVAHLRNGKQLGDTQTNPYHITTWTVLLLFHLNMWMKAVTHQDLNILNTHFNNCWARSYESCLRYGSAPKVSLLRSLELLEYRHDKCKIRGTCLLYCPNCSVDYKATMAKGSKSGQNTKAYYARRPPVEEDQQRRHASLVLGRASARQETSRRLTFIIQ